VYTHRPSLRIIPITGSSPVSRPFRMRRYIIPVDEHTLLDMTIYQVIHYMQGMEDLEDQIVFCIMPSRKSPSLAPSLALCFPFCQGTAYSVNLLLGHTRIWGTLKNVTPGGGQKTPLDISITITPLAPWHCVPGSECEEHLTFSGWCDPPDILRMPSHRITNINNLIFW
jgi:hypothetical protein